MVTSREGSPTKGLPAVQLPAAYTHRRVYTAAEVEKHCKGTASCWVSFFGKVYDLSPLLALHDGDPLALPILEAAGTDISHWFDPDTHEPRLHMDWHSGSQEVYCPQGRYIHIPPADPVSTFDGRTKTPWWKDNGFLIGKLAKKTVKINISNTLTKEEIVMELPCEETVREIERRYLAAANFHSKSYTWKRLSQCLDMDKTLEANGVHDDSGELIRLGFDPDDHIITLHLYFNDDLTEA